MASLSIRGNTGILILSILFLVAGALRLNRVSLYTPDSSNYLIWGNSLAHGKGFVDDTPPAVNRFVVNAPFYALLIAPVEALAPLSIPAVKLWTLCWGALALVLFHRYLLRYFSRNAALAGAACFAFNPAFLLFSTEMLSEAPFIAFLLAILLLLERFRPSDEASPRFWVMGLLVVLIATVGLLREVGIAIVAACALYFYSVKMFKRSAIVIVSAAIVLGAWYYRNQVWVGAVQGPQRGNLFLITQHFVTGPQASGWAELGTRILQSMYAYGAHLSEMVIYPGFSGQLTDLIAGPAGVFRAVRALVASAGILISLGALVVMIAGLVADLRRAPTAWLRAIFCLLYLLIVLAYPIHDIRFLLPLTPLILLYLMNGVRWAVELFRPAVLPRTRLLATAILAALMVIPNGLAVGELLRTNQQFVRSPEALRKNSRLISSLYTCDWDTIHAWIEQHTGPSTVFASPMKELAVVSDGRKVVDLDPGTPVSAFETALRDYQVEYILAFVQGDLNVYEFPMGQTRRFWFEPVCDGGNIHLLRVHARNLESRIGGRAFSPPDSIASIRLMRAGREALLGGDYARAESILTDAYRRFPRHPSIVYETMTAALFSGDTTRARELYKALMALPQTLSYTSLARLQFDAMNFMTTSRRSGMMEERAVTRYKAASLYWKLGYYRRAAEVMDTLLAINSEYFYGLLWGLHFHLQNGDTAVAMRYLGRLGTIDSTNIVGKTFARILTLGDSLGAVSSDSARAAIHLALAHLYFQIDLKEEAIDEGERALACVRDLPEAHLFLAQVYERKGALRAAERLFRKALFSGPRNPALEAHLDSLRQKIAG